MKNPCAEVDLPTMRTTGLVFDSYLITTLSGLRISSLEDASMLPGGLVIQRDGAFVPGYSPRSERLGTIVGIARPWIYVAWGPWVPEREPYHELVATFGRQAQSASKAIARLSQALQSAAKTLNLAVPQTTTKKVPNRGKNDKKRSRSKRRR